MTVRIYLAIVAGVIVFLSGWRWAGRRSARGIERTIDRWTGRDDFDVEEGDVIRSPINGVVRRGRSR